MQAVCLPTTEQSKYGFYPTPPELATRMMQDIDWHQIDTILEPSVGKPADSKRVP